MPGISPKLPLTVDQADGPYKLTKTIIEALTQDFRMLLLTNPGERIMDPSFGVGVRNFLFQNSSPSVFDEITSRIISQTRTYLPQINVEKVIFNESTDDGMSEDMFDSNVVSITIRFSVKPISNQEILTISLL